MIAMRDFTTHHLDARGDDGLHFAGEGAARASAWLAERVTQLLGDDPRIDTNDTISPG